ncbi:MAG: fibrobacter succinogenes major paralogous domain-containing protein [Fibromonadales bacterium]|nr:fibrobacter succinogenes major paralogous domain-containing protein [Fibromonadales bacterium]
MKYCLLFAALALLILACGEVGSGGGSDSDRQASSSSVGLSSGQASSSSSEKEGKVTPCPWNFDPLQQFCFDESLYDRCGGEEYNPNTRFCFQNKFYLKCGGEEYDPLIQFCSSDGETYLRCGGKERDPKNEFCFGGSVVPMCAGENYNPDEEFCIGDKLYPKCNGNEFLPTEQFCLKAKLYSICNGDDKYDTSAKTCCGGELLEFAGNEFCFEERSYSKCGGEAFNLRNEFCIEDKLYAKCNGEEYDPSERFCFDNKFYLLCGGKEYNPVKETCFEGNPYARCGSKAIDPDEEFCFDGNIVSKCAGQNFNPDEEFCFRGKLELKCNGNEYNLDEQTCYKTRIYPICEGKTVPEYDPVTQTCFNNSLYFICGENEISQNSSCNPKLGVCKDETYDVARQFCYEGSVYAKCEGKGYPDFNPLEHFCGSDNESGIPIEKIRPMCRTLPCGESLMGATIYCLETYDDINLRCVGGNKLEPRVNETKVLPEICDGEEYYPTTHFCESNIIYPMCGNLELKPDECCNGVKYSKEQQFCFSEQLYPNCEKEPINITIDGKKYSIDYPYNPLDSGCFGNQLYANCTNSNARGLCAHNSLLRCRQEGKDNSYIRDPLPGMKCINDIDDPRGNVGAIVGNTASGISVAQIGRQIWMAENADNNLFHSWALANNLHESCDTTNTSVPDTTDWGRPRIVERCSDQSSCLHYNNSHDNDYRTPPSSISGCQQPLLPLESALPDNNGSNYPLCRITQNYIPPTVVYRGCTPSSRSSQIIPTNRARCPQGFYMANDDDWKELMDYAGGVGLAGGRLKSQSDWSSDGNGTDNFGFNAKPHGYHEGILAPIGHVEEGFRSMWWSENSTKLTGSYWTIISSDTELRNASQIKGGVSGLDFRAQVRCLYYYNRGN